ncbi:unnamed protein product [Chilo suppressalis]|uniref:Uncharacterized protein n=1 Tax=Chilo suppressalis TaxID=168631 RepID=A0ABN8EBZ4_CHISP|nr:unnamed protein product [Chilo suppressalis]
MTSLILLKSILFSNALQKTRKKKKKGRRPMNKKTSPVCRICFKEQGTVPIFNNILYPSIPIEIRNFSGVTINESQDTSNYMCKNCLDLLNGCIMFRELCQKNNKHLVEVAVKSENKIYERDKKLQESVDSYNIPSPAFSIDNSEIWGCSTCSTAFENLETYNTHLTACSSQANKDSKATDEVKVKRKFLCDICGKTSHSNASLQIHMSTHENVFPFKCEVCPYQGRTLDLLRVHKRSHMVDKPFKCSQCPKSTTTASNLAKHMRHVHSNTRPYKCTYCDKAFSYQHDMKRHIKDIHLRQGTVECDLCFKKFNTKKILQGHRSKIHNIKGERQGRLPSYLQCQIIDETIENIINDDNST